MAQRYSHRMRVRYAECDQQRVVFNAHYFAYFDVALTEVWRHAGIPYERMIASGTDMVVVEARARFHAPARFDDEIELEWWATRLGNTSLTSRIDVKRGGELLVEGELSHVFMDLATRRQAADPGRHPPGAGRLRGGDADSEAEARA